jgi:hypothetical protein
VNKIANKNVLPHITKVMVISKTTESSDILF